MTTATSTRRRRGAPSTATLEAEYRREVSRWEDTVQLLTERLHEATGVAAGQVTESGTAELERAIISDPGWRRFAVVTQQEFTDTGMQQIRAVCRLMAIANPMIKRGVNLRVGYVWGQGVQITARATGKRTETEQDVAAVVAAHIDDPANQRAWYGQQAREENERASSTDGEVYAALFTQAKTGWVNVRTIAADEIAEVLTNPEDIGEPWFYRRVWNITTYSADGVKQPATREMLYPDVDYKPTRRPSKYAGVDIQWDTPIVHVHVNRPKGWLRGIPDVYAVVNWARAYKEFLEQWAALMRSLAKFAWRLTTDGRNRQQAKAALAAAGTSRNVLGERNDVGGTAITPADATLEAIPKTGATIDSESGRPLAAMVAAGLDLPVTMLLGDPGTTGNRATAETLDWPTELAMGARRSVWTAADLRILQYRITEAVRAPQGPLKGTIKRDPVTGREVVTLAGDTDDTVDIVWPELDDVDPKTVIDAVVAANGTGTLPPKHVLRLLLQALGFRDVDSILDEMVDEQGNFLWPQTPQNAGMGPGQQAADLARAGGDPAAAGPGSMGPDGEPMPEPPAGGDPNTAAIPTTEQGVSPEALARQADAEFGLFGSEPPVPDDGVPDTPTTDDTPAGAEEEPAGDTGAPPTRVLYDPARFKI